MVICITGTDASGKATQSKRLAESLGAAHFTFPAYETIAGKAILGSLKGHWKVMADVSTDGPVEEIATNALVLQSLMTTNRLERMADLRAAAARGHVVLDRYDVDALVYGTRDGLDAGWLESLNAQLGVRPDVYVLLDVPVEEGMRRRPERRDRYERDLDMLEGVRLDYLRLFSQRQDEFVKQGLLSATRWRVVDGVGSIEEVAERIRKAVML